MQLPALLTSDLHLTAAPRDAYRWSLFDYVADQCQVEQVRTVCILGDLTDAKDYHPSSLTNDVVKQIARLTHLPTVEQVLILMGNHDYLRAGHSYFEFLNELPGVRFITKPWEDTEGDVNTYWLPHTKTPAKDWAGMDFSHYNYVFMHQTVSGSIASNGMKMDGEALPPFEGCKVYSGDIHVPQVIGDVEYVGSPYHVHFGDSFSPRLVLLDRRNRAVDLSFESPRRLALTVPSVRELKRFEFRPGDHIKLRIELDAADKHDWSRQRRLALEHLKAEQVEVHGVDLRVTKTGQEAVETRLQGGRSVLPAPKVVEAFVKAQDLGGDVLDAGLDLVEP